MNELVKIKDVAKEFSVTPRTLRFYEDMGLLTSIRSEEYAYRMYDESAINRLKQILILRKMNISIKDITRIMTADDSQFVLDVLQDKADDIDNEVALLHELKQIVLNFIKQIRKSDFHSDSDIKKLYDMAEDVESHITSGNEDIDNEENVNRLLEVTEKLEDNRITTPIAIKTYKERVGPMRFIGQKFSSGGEAWTIMADGCGVDSVEKFNNNIHTERIGINLKELYEDGDSLIGLMNHRNGFEYWLGYFTPANTPVPEGYEYEDFPEVEIGTCWLYGHDSEIYAVEPIAYEKLGEEGFDVDDYWWFERYHPIRNMPDKKGNAIIDICFFIK